jgi:predicted extracellular nuclease
MAMNSTANVLTIAFYNIENLFDPFDNTTADDNDFLPFSKKRWTTKRYTNKLNKIGHAISQIGPENLNTAPALVGLAEVENKKVLTDLIRVKPLEKENYGFIHYDSPDERGIDVALLYKKEAFKLNHSESFPVYLEDDLGQRDYTRDILLVEGELKNETLNIIVNHWSSRREGEKETEHKRLAAATVVNSIIQDIKSNNDDAKIIVMGDFNDNPENKSIKLMEAKSQLYNPFKTVWSRDAGSLSHNFEWHLFDQILCSTNFLNSEKSALVYNNAAVFDDRFLTQYDGKYKGQPFRTYVGKHYKGGYSDHFPVYMELKHP